MRAQGDAAAPAPFGGALAGLYLFIALPHLPARRLSFPSEFFVALIALLALHPTKTHTHSRSEAELHLLYFGLGLTVFQITVCQS